MHLGKSVVRGIDFEYPRIRARPEKFFFALVSLVSAQNVSFDERYLNVMRAEKRFIILLRIHISKAIVILQKTETTHLICNCILFIGYLSIFYLVCRAVTIYGQARNILNPKLLICAVLIAGSFLPRDFI